MLRTSITDLKALRKQSFITIMLTADGFIFLHFEGSEAEAEKSLVLHSLYDRKCNWRDKH